MKHSRTTLIALAFLFASGASSANAPKSEAAAKPVAGSHAGAPANGGKASKAKGTAVKLVDINSAGKAELKTLPGIDDALAEKIIKGRPYLSKAFLVTSNIIPRSIYELIKRRIIARQK